MLKRITLLAATLALTAATARADIHIVDNDVKMTVDCAKDKSVHVSGNKANLTLSGTCVAVNVSGNQVTVRGSAAQVHVSGNDNTLALDAVDQILVSGNNNTISYKKAGKAKKTSVMDSGTDNKLSQTK